MPGPICSVNFSRIGPAVSEILTIQLAEHYWTVFYDMGVIPCKLRLLEAIQNWYFECMSFTNCSTDLLAIFIQSVKVYTHCVCEISQWSESNCMFENQKIEITYQNYSSLNTWATLMKQKPNYSQYVEQEEDIFRYVKNSERTREIRCHSDWNFSTSTSMLPMIECPPLSNYVLFLAIYQCLRVFEGVVVKFWHVCNLRLPFHISVKFDI